MNTAKEHAMELLDRYLEAIRKHLPWQRQDDIIAELRANLEAQLEEKEAALGRPLTAGEMEDWLKQLGSPMRMAAPYQPQQYLIGPAVYPIYRHVLKLTCSWALIIYCIATVAGIFASPQPSLAPLIDGLLKLPMILLYTAAWCTFIFAIVEYAISKGRLPSHALGPFAASWAPAGLSTLSPPLAPGKKPKTYMQAAIEICFGILFLGWLLLIPKYPWLILGPGAFYLDQTPYQLAPVWTQFYWCIIALNILQNGWNVENLLRGKWQKPQPVKQVVFKAVPLFAFLIMVVAPNHLLILLKHPALNQVRYGAQLNAINQYVYGSFLVLAAITVLQLAWDLLRLYMAAYHKRVAA
jgi:hypothetical protein